MIPLFAAIRLNSAFSGRRSVVIRWILAFQAILLLSCAHGQSSPVTQDIQKRELRDEEIRDVSLTMVLISSAERRALHRADDPVASITEYWSKHDPSPYTSTNEALETFRQRADYLRNRFPDVPISDVAEPWLSFLKHGHWDWIHSGSLPYQLQNLNRPGVSASAASTRALANFVTDALIFGTPETFDVYLNENRILRGREIPEIPSLRRVWDILENPDARRSQKAEALRMISWYEIPPVVERLLNIPDRALSEVQTELDVCYRRLAVRRAYCLGTEGARRLAAITAAGASSRLQLFRTMEEEYSSAQFQIDIDSLLKNQIRESGSVVKNPHPSLRRKPEELLRELAERFPTDKSLTGWDWRGDLHLAYGPPYHLDELKHTARYTYEYPVDIGIRSGVLGAVDTVLLKDWIQTYRSTQYREILDRRTEAQLVLDELKAVITEASQTSDVLLAQLHRLLPLKTQNIGLMNPDESMYITMDVVAFPDSSNTIDIFASLGIPFDEIERYSSGTGFRTDLETCCLLFDSEQHIIWDEKHDGGFTIANPVTSITNLFLVDAFRCRTAPGSYSLYCSVLDPETEKSRGILVSLDLQAVESSDLFLSPLALAGKVGSEEAESGFTRRGYHILPYPGRDLLYGEDIWLYFEVNQLARSEYGDHAWEESYFLIPDRAGMGIVRLSPGMIHSSLQPHADRYIMIDLSEMEGDYVGPLFIVILITDAVSGNNALTAARFSIYRPEK